MSHILQKPYTNKQYADLAVYCNENGLIIEDKGEFLEMASPIVLIEDAKALKLAENIQKREERLHAGVEYKGVLFDSDTDSKVNVMGAVKTLPDDAVVGWNSMDNQTITLTKAELVELGEVLFALTSAIWGENGLNVQYINAVNSAETIEALEAIEIDYSKLLVN